MTSPVLLFSMVSLAILAISSGSMMTGGWSRMSEADKSQLSFKAVLQAAAAAYSAKYSSTNGGQATLFHVKDAMQQVVAGMKYHFTARLAACKHCHARRCEFTIWQRVGPISIEVLDMVCK